MCAGCHRAHDAPLIRALNAARRAQQRADAAAARPRLRPLLTLQEAADYLGVPVATLYQWRLKGAGPRSVRVGRYLRYGPGDVEMWLNEQGKRPRAGTP